MGFEELVSALRSEVSSFDPSEMPGDEAARMVELLAEGEKLCAAAKTLALRRVQETLSWRESGERSAARWLARRTGSTLKEAASSLFTAVRLDQASATRAAFVAGALSGRQAAEISAAAVADPAAEDALIALSRTESFGSLKQACRVVIAAAAADEDAAERIRRHRYLRDWIDDDGAVRLDAKLAPDDGARLLVQVRALQAKLEREAARSGQREKQEAYAADALVALAGGAVPPGAVVHVEVDATALERGHTAPGEVCHIPGVAPVPVSVAKRLALAGSVKLIGRDGAEISSVAHLGRTIPAHVRTALEARDRTCVVPGCEISNGLEIDHIVPFAVGGPTTLSNLARLCRWHHAQKTHHGWVLRGSPGAWKWTRERAPPTSGP